MSMEEIRSILDEADTNRDGKLDYKEVNKICTLNRRIRLNFFISYRTFPSFFTVYSGVFMSKSDDA